MSYHLFLDDERIPGQVTWVALPTAIWQVVRNYDEFVSMILDHGVPKFITFDHDLADAHYAAMLEEVNTYKSTKLLWMPGDEIEISQEPTVDYGPEKTGYECAKWLVDHCIDNNLRFPEYQVHSMNPVGSKRIRDYIEWAKSKISTL